jgi:hypothetical protein
MVVLTSWDCGMSDCRRDPTATHWVGFLSFQTGSPVRWYQSSSGVFSSLLERYPEKTERARYGCELRRGRANVTEK